MEEQLISATAKGISDFFARFPDNTKVYMSRDSEGNGYGSIQLDGWGIYHSKEDNAIALYPATEHIEFDAIFPKAYEKEVK